MSVQPRVTRRGGLLDWIKFDFELARDGSVDPTDKALYAAIASFVDVESRESPDVSMADLNAIPRDVPTRQRLAKCIGRSVDTVDRSTKRLEAKGLLRVHRQPDPDRPKLNLPSEYELLDHELWDERAADRAARRAARRKSSEGVSTGERGGRMDAATPGRTGAATPGRMDAAVKDVGEVEEEKEGESRLDGRRPSSTGSSARAREGGFAASSKDQSPKAGKPAKHTREHLKLVEQVRAYLPEQLREGTHVPSVSDAILKVLDPENPESRTVEQLGARIQHRWVAHGYSSQEIRNPISVVTKLVKPYERGDRFGCPNPRCEDGVILETGEECTTCVARIAERRAEARRKAAQEAQQDAPAAPEPQESGPAPVTPQEAAWGAEVDYYPDLPAAGAGEAPDWAAPAEPVIPQQHHTPDRPYGGDALHAARQAVRANKGLVR